MDDPPRYEVDGRFFFNSKLANDAAIAHILGLDMSLTRLSASVANLQLAQVTTTGLWLGLFTTDPGTAGSAGEIPANSASGYTQSARQQIVWAAMATGSVSSSVAPVQTFTLGASWSAASIGYFGIFNASVSGTYLQGGVATGLGSAIPAGAVITFTGAIEIVQSG